jgi:DNA-binding transcriptional ArsR family regulator
METATLAMCFKALGEPARLRILQRLPLTNNCEDVYNVSELAEELDIPQPMVSHHLQILHRAGLVQSAKMCRDVYYWIDQPAVDHALAALQDLLQAGPDPQINSTVKTGG